MLSPPAKTPAVRKSMQGNKGNDTKPELIARKLLRDAGYPGYRLQWKKAPGRPDIAYPGRKIAIFINGCFWHRCPRCKLPTPKSNSDYWTEKFSRNVERDKRKVEELEKDGWKVLIVWECDLKDADKRQSVEYAFIDLAEGIFCDTLLLYVPAARIAPLVPAARIAPTVPTALLVPLVSATRIAPLVPPTPITPFTSLAPTTPIMHYNLNGQEPL
jgi:DNA mismatch endonuclease (patch repair protein)